MDEFEDSEDDFEDSEDDEKQNNVFVEEKFTYRKDIDELSKIMETITNGLVESHLEDKADQLNYILSRFTNKKVEKVVLERISELPDYVKKADIGQTLSNMSDDEIEKLYLDVEKVK